MGTDDVIQRSKAQHVTKDPHPEIPQQRWAKKEGALQAVVRSAARVLGCEEHALKGKPLWQRDLIIYFLWEMGLFTNSDIGASFGLSYSAVSRWAALVNNHTAVDPAIKKQIEMLSAQTKI